MKKRLIAICCVFGLLLAVANAQATPISLSYGAGNYVGLINDGIPSNPADETAYLGNLITLAAGAPLQQIGTESYSRVGSTLASLPNGFTFVEKQDNADVYQVMTSGTFYVLGKYDADKAGAWVWLVDALVGDTISLPNVFPTANHPEGYGLSHTTVWSTSTTPVPEPGTILLLGAGLVGLGFFGRKRMKS